jgi:hypothetical protein
MTTKFVREKDLVERLVQRLGLDVGGYEDPNASGSETGADVTILHGDCRIGVQVTILDTGTVPGESIAKEKAQAREATGTHGGVYGGWGQNQPMAAIVAAVTKKSATDVAGFDEVWLLVSCGIPEHGAIISTLLMTNCLTAAALTAATAATLARSSYGHAFLHPITALEDALYEWTPAQQWQKHIRPRPDRKDRAFGTFNG